MFNVYRKSGQGKRFKSEKMKIAGTLAIIITQITLTMSKGYVYWQIDGRSENGWDSESRCPLPFPVLLRPFQYVT